MNSSMDKSAQEPKITEIIDWFKGLQDRICTGLEAMDRTSRFHQDLWERAGGGGGRTRIIQGEHIEKGGVNFSAVDGTMPERIAQALGLPPNEFSATGVSIVLHASNPWVPIIHMNVRYFETDSGTWWFGGGIDVTPHVIVPEEARRFHKRLKTVCDVFDPGTYGEYKTWADDYFYLAHREETRGIGGIFFDRLNNDKGYTKESCWKFVCEVGESFVPLYAPLFMDNFKRDHSEEDKQWQNIRRSRYVEFNLVYDKGTKFGLQTNGRIESILMSLPPQARWHYDYKPNRGSVYQKTLDLLRKGIDWVNYTEG